MRNSQRTSTAGRLLLAPALLLTLAVGLQPVPAAAQVVLGAAQLDQLVARVVLYPDALLAQVLTASTYSEQVPDAAQWADQHSYLTGDNLAKAIAEDNLP
jgi:hypothetical protein